MRSSSIFYEVNDPERYGVFEFDEYCDAFSFEEKEKQAGEIK